MVYLEMINEVFKSANNLLDFVFFWGGWLLILEYPLVFFAKGIYKNIKEKHKLVPGIVVDLLSQTIILFIVVFLAGIFWTLPDILLLRFAWAWSWLALYHLLLLSNLPQIERLSGASCRSNQ